MPITTWKEANDALRDLGLAQAAIAGVNAKLKADITPLKVAAEAAAAPDVAREKELTAQLKTFWEAHSKDEEVTGKSKELTYGTIGTSLTPKAVSLLAKVDAKKAVASIKAIGKAFFERYTKTADPTLDKRSILAAKGKDLEQLEACGIRITQEDEFYATPSAAALISTPADPEPAQ